MAYLGAKKLGNSQKKAEDTGWGSSQPALWSAGGRASSVESRGTQLENLSVPHTHQPLTVEGRSVCPGAERNRELEGDVTTLMHDFSLTFSLFYTNLIGTSSRYSHSPQHFC